MIRAKKTKVPLLTNSLDFPQCLQVHWCHGLNICAPSPNSYAEILIPKDDDISRWGPFGRWSGQEDGPLIMGLLLLWVIPQKSLDTSPASSKWGHNEKVPAMNQKQGPHPAMLAWCFRTSSLQYCEQLISVVYKLPLKHPYVVFCYCSPNGLRYHLLESWTYWTRNNKTEEAHKWN